MERFLAHVEPFQRLSPAERQRLAAVSREKRYAKGETIFRAGEPAEAIDDARQGQLAAQTAE